MIMNQQAIAELKAIHEQLTGITYATLTDEQEADMKTAETALENFIESLEE